MSDIVEMLKGYLNKHHLKFPNELINIVLTGDYALAKHTMMSDIDILLVFKGDIFKEDELIMKKLLNDFCEYPAINTLCISNKSSNKKIKKEGVILWKRI